MLRLIVVCWLSVLGIALGIADAKTSAKTYGCQLLPVVRTFPSRLYPTECTLTVPTYVCAGFCESAVEPVKAKKSKEYEDVWDIQFKQDCYCCIPTARKMHTAVIDEWKLDCPSVESEERNESVTLQWPSHCSCTQCRGSARVG